MKWCVLIIFSPDALGALELIAICANKRGILGILLLTFPSSELPIRSFVSTNNRLVIYIIFFTF